MAKSTAAFFCSECGYETSGWLGKCPSCNSWNTIVESTSVTGKKSSKGKSQTSGGWLSSLDLESSLSASTTGDPDKLSKISLNQVSRQESDRLFTGMNELDRVLGGGLVKGSVVLVGGVPGVGKSTLLMQVCEAISSHGDILYISGEESVSQIGLRADRLGVKSEKIYLMPQTSFTLVAHEIIEKNPVCVIVDSIQTMYLPESPSSPGSVAQVKETTAGMLKLAKTLNIPVILVGHVTKDGSIAGPKILEHMVDTVIYFEGEGHGQYRILRVVKNRFGPTDEIGIFEMTDKGLTQVANPSSAMLIGRPRGVAGTAITSCIEGTRPVLLEVQALLNPVSYSNPARVTQGLDRVRVGMILAVIDKIFNLGLNVMDAYINVVGELTGNDNSFDLAVVAAVISAVKGKAISDKLVIFGELGLTGEIRSVANASKRAMEAKREGFSSCLLPGACRKQFKYIDSSKLPDLIFVDNLREMMDLMWG